MPPLGGIQDGPLGGIQEGPLGGVQNPAPDGPQSHEAVVDLGASISLLSLAQSSTNDVVALSILGGLAELSEQDASADVPLALNGDTVATASVADRIDVYAWPSQVGSDVFASDAYNQGAVDGVEITGSSLLRAGGTATITLVDTDGVTDILYGGISVGAVIQNATEIEVTIPMELYDIAMGSVNSLQATHATLGSNVFPAQYLPPVGYEYVIFNDGDTFVAGSFGEAQHALTPIFAGDPAIYETGKGTLYPDGEWIPENGAINLSGYIYDIADHYLISDNPFTFNAPIPVDADIEAAVELGVNASMQYGVLQDAFDAVALSISNALTVTGEALGLDEGDVGLTATHTITNAADGIFNGIQDLDSSVSIVAAANVDGAQDGAVSLAMNADQDAAANADLLGVVAMNINGQVFQLSGQEFEVVLGLSVDALLDNDGVITIEGELSLDTQSSMLGSAISEFYSAMSLDVIQDLLADVVTDVTALSSLGIENTITVDASGSPQDHDGDVSLTLEVSASTNGNLNFIATIVNPDREVVLKATDRTILLKAISSNVNLN